MKNNFLIIFFVGLILTGCVGVASKGIFGTGVSVAFDPRSVGTQVDDSIMEKNLSVIVVIIKTKKIKIETKKQELKKQLEVLPRKDIAAKSLENSDLILVNSKEEMVDMVN